MVELKCYNCNMTYFKKRADPRAAKSYCSKECQSAGQITKKEVTCKTCNTVFFKQLSQITENNFCTRSCSAKFNNRGVQRNKPKAGEVTKKEVICKTCNTAFFKKPYQVTENNFCTRSCAAKFNNRGVQRVKPKKRTCALCSSDFFSSKDHQSLTSCPKCFGNVNSIVSIEEYVGKNKLISKDVKKIYLQGLTISDLQNRNSIAGKHTSWASSHIRNLNRSWNKNLLNIPCQNCGYYKHIELCHIKSVSSFDKDEKLSVVNDPNNILVLCRNCHWEFDNKLLLLTDIPKRNSS